MFGARKLGPDNLPLDQNIVLLFFEYLLGSPDERGVWRILGKRPPGRRIVGGAEVGSAMATGS